MGEKGSQSPGSTPMWALLLIAALGQARNIVLLAREVRTWWSKPKQPKPPSLPPSL